MLSLNRPRAIKYSNTSVLLVLFIIILSLYTLWDFVDDQSPREAAIPGHIEEEDSPRKIWYKLGPHGLSRDAMKWADGCRAKNPGYTAEYMMDQNIEDWVRREFADRPDVVETYLNLSVPIFKADLLRYMLLYREGGMWLDLDVECGDTPIDNWVPAHLQANTSLVVGWEFDAGLRSDVSHQLASWTILSRGRPGASAPHMMMVVDDIVRAVHEETNEHSVPIAGLKLHMVPDVVDFTGPARMTRSIFKSLERTLGRDVDRMLVQNILEPTLLGDVLFMPGWAFAAAQSQGKYPEEDRDRIGSPLVIHH